ncbi:hypothetical protein HJC23_004074 [Cyclotella cryptica]|uniref:Uncharacterized protein n=1 Tax=Cyclotella cryptica TaxID=29204 RepID=A0ABD3PIR1_9STRA
MNICVSLSGNNVDKHVNDEHYLNGGKEKDSPPEDYLTSAPQYDKSALTLPRRMNNSYTQKRANQRKVSMTQPSSCDSWDQKRSSQQPQPRRVSYLVDSVENTAQERALLEEWPRRVTFVDQDDMSISSSTSHKAVSFSPHSRLHVYPVNEDERLKSYSSSERKLFQAQALYNAFRIQELIQSCPYEGGAAIRHLIDRNLLGPEELLGIENLIVGAAKISKERRVHSRIVVEKQREMRKNNDVNIEQKLADVAVARSLKSIEKARLRAALAA